MVFMMNMLRRKRREGVVAAVVWPQVGRIRVATALKTIQLILASGHLRPFGI